MQTRYEYEYQNPGASGFLRASFAKRQDLGYPAAPTDRKAAFEMLQVIAPRWKPGTQMRLVLIDEAIDQEVLTVGQ